MVKTEFTGISAAPYISRAIVLTAESSNGFFTLEIDAAGKIIRLLPKEIRTMGRQAAGVRLIRLSPEQKLMGISVVDGVEESAGDEVVTPDRGQNEPVKGA